MIMEVYSMPTYFYQPKNVQLAHKKLLSIGPIDVHPTELIIILNYSLQLLILSHQGDEPFEKLVTCRKFIRLCNLNFESDADFLVHWIISKCFNLLNSTYFGELIQQIEFLRDRQTNSFKRIATLDLFYRHSSSHISIDKFENSDISKIQNYFYLLYEGIHEKIKATNFILQLARQPENLSTLIRNEVLIGALARVLRDEWKKCMDLTKNIIYIFFCFSSFSCYHVLVSKYKIGSLCMQVIQQESSLNKMVINELNLSDSNSEEKRQNLPDVDVCFSDSDIQRQEEILLISVYLLLHISENKNIEMKMLKKGLIPSLISLLDGFNLELLITSVCFLKKLSIFTENKDRMLKHSIVSRLQRIISFDYLPLKQIAWSLIFNLSFDPDTQENRLPIFFPNFGIFDFFDSHEISKLFGILYHVSIHPRSYNFFQNSEAILFFKSMIQRFNDEIIDLKFVALLINLLQSFEISKSLLDCPNLKVILNRSFDLNDPLLLKIVNTGLNHSEFDHTLLLPFIHFLLNHLHLLSSETILLEIYKILNCISSFSSKLIQPLIHPNLIILLVRQIKYFKHMEEDLLLEIIIFIGILAIDQFLASMFIQNGLIYIITVIFREKQVDDEIVMQIIYILYVLLFHPMTRKTIYSESFILVYLSEVFNDDNQLVSSYCEDTLNLIIEQDISFSNDILHDRFNWHNLRWLELLNGNCFEELQIQHSDMDNILLHFPYSNADVNCI